MSLVYFAFDLLEFDGEDIARLPLLERKKQLAAPRRKPSAGIAGSQDESGDREAFRRAASRHRLEGIVSKQFDRPYLLGDRGAWVNASTRPSSSSRDGRLRTAMASSRRYAGRLGEGGEFYQRIF